MEWVHCNCCNRQPSENKKFCLTNCGHLFCEDCVVQDKEPCKVCGQICMVLLLTAPLKPEVAIYFTEPYEMLQKYFKEFTKIMEFQKGHGKKLIAGFKGRICSLNDKLHDALKKIGELENENENLKQENVHLRETLNNSPFRGIPAQGGGGGVVLCPTSVRMSAPSSTSTCSSNESTLVQTPTRDAAIPGGHHQQQRKSSVITTPMTSKRLSIHTPQREVLLSGNSSGSMFSRRSQESQALKMLSQSPAFSSSVSNKRHATSTTSNAGQNPNTPSSRPQMTRNPTMSLPRLKQHSGHYLPSATITRGYNRCNTLGRHVTLESVDQLSPLSRPISLKVDYPSLRSELKNYLASKSNLPTPSWRH